MRHHATVKSTRFNKRPKQNLSATNPHDSDTSKHFNQESKPNCNAKKQQASQAFVLVLKGMRSLFLQHVETCSNKHAKKKKKKLQDPEYPLKFCLLSLGSRKKLYLSRKPTIWVFRNTTSIAHTDVTSKEITKAPGRVSPMCSS